MDIYEIKKKFIDKYVWKCVNKKCLKYKTTKSIRKLSIFEKFKVSLKIILHVLYLWSLITQIKIVCQSINCTRQFVAKNFQCLRKECGNYFMKYPLKLGGQNIVCQIDESLFSHKRK